MWYHYNQNNSGGSFTGPAINVWVEAKSAEEANERAREHGLYFNGVSNGSDCSCCGDRWYEATDWRPAEELDIRAYDSGWGDVGKDYEPGRLYGSDRAPYGYVVPLEGEAYVVPKPTSWYHYGKDGNTKLDGPAPVRRR